ncbi:MAG: alpha/beta hydrolase [Acidimicrobiales bacterium]
MATFVLIHGAGGSASSWNLVAAELQAAGHDTVAMDLPCDDPSAGLAEYRDAVVAAIGDRREDLVLVAQSLGGFTAPLVADRVRVDLIVLVTAMIPLPGETGGDWWGHVGVAEAIAAQGLSDQSDEALFLHDVPPDVLAASESPRDQTGRVMEEPWPLAAWPDVRTRFLLCTGDRFFPPEWMRGVVRARLGIEPDEIPGGHCAYLSQPGPMAAAILRAWSDPAS